MPEWTKIRLGRDVHEALRQAAIVNDRSLEEELLARLDDADAVPSPGVVQVKFRLSDETRAKFEGAKVGTLAQVVCAALERSL